LIKNISRSIYFNTDGEFFLPREVLEIESALHPEKASLSLVALILGASGTSLCIL